VLRGDTWGCSKLLLQHGAVPYYCNFSEGVLLHHSAATRCCNMWLQRHPAETCCRLKLLMHPALAHRACHNSQQLFWFALQYTDRLISKCFESEDQVTAGVDVLILFLHKNSLFRHNRFSAIFFSMKIAESDKIVLVSCIIDFKDI
jgi:hypothetical protein